MEDMLTSLSTYGYLILFFYTLGGGLVALIAAGVLSFSGELNIVLCIVIAFISNAIGDTLLFYLSRYNKKEFMPYIKKQRRNLALAQVLFKKYGDRIILIKKYIYGLKTLIPIAIGLTNYSFFKFTIINLISSFIWALSIGLASYYAGNMIVSLYETLKIYPWIMPIAIFAILGSIVFYFKKMTKKKSAIIYDYKRE